MRYIHNGNVLSLEEGLDYSNAEVVKTLEEYTIHILKKIFFHIYIKQLKSIELILQVLADLD